MNKISTVDVNGGFQYNAARPRNIQTPTHALPKIATVRSSTAQT